jgi:hypothetical protein
MILEQLTERDGDTTTIINNNNNKMLLPIITSSYAALYCDTSRAEKD